jgi:bidirectional [NiFe] hydrogenase diaphorase subunit
MDLAELHHLGERERQARKAVRIRCCTAACCLAGSGQAVKDALAQAAADAGLTDRVQVCGVGCLRLCCAGPLVEVDPAGVLYEHVAPSDAPAIVAALQGGPAPIRRTDVTLPFFTRQTPVVLENCGWIEPERIESYIAVGGYEALHQALHEMTPAQVVEAVSRSGLRGRGGAGYPTGLKWATAARQPPGPRFVVCNADEGDPGAFMDRGVLESDPHRVLEGMAIAAYAVGADHGYIYVRGEYPLAIHRLRTAIRQATQFGLLGSGVLDSPFNLRIDVRIGAGAYVCGEETALIASIEGRRGTPRPRPPYPAERGLWSCPTLINNVETFANVPTILRKGADWFAAIGTEKSKGTKVFSLSGKVRYSGLIEVPMGTTVKHIVEEMGGGAPDGTVKAVLTGGPSGGCIPAEHLDTPVDYESLVKLGTTMGSGGMIVMDQTSNMVDVARFFMEFCMDESCGKCIPCRAGTVQMHQLLTRIVQKRATRTEYDRLVHLCHMVRDTSLCGLGQTAPNPVLSTMRYFAHEYEALLQPSPPGGKANAMKPLTVV